MIISFTVNLSIIFVSIIIIANFHMGNECLATTPNQKYNRYLQNIDISELKDLWQTVKVYKIKEIFEEVSEPNPHYPNHTHLPYQQFKQLFTELQNYPQQQIQRLFQFFDYDSKGFVDWNSFFSAITICYYGTEKELALLMFMMFDHALEFQLQPPYQELMLQTNEDYLKTNQKDEHPDYEEVLSQLRKKDCFSVGKWLQVAEGVFDFNKFRKVFNIFSEQKMQKELVKHFSSWNTIFNEQKQKYIGYLVDLKWFQSWKLYISHQYNVKIEIYQSVLDTINTVRTCKKMTTKSLTASRKKTQIDSNKDPHGYRYMKIPRDRTKDSYLKDIDCLHGHLGERPRDITNGELEGEFQEVLRNNMGQNMDYAIVSEQVWNHLKTIYGGYPEFRRTGFDSIELYPKIACLYFSLFKGSIDYSSEVLRQVSSYLSVEQMLTKSCDIGEEDMNNKVIFYKTIGMKRWQLLDDPSYLFTELTSDILLFMACLPKQEKEAFLKSHQKHPRDVTEVNLGDTLTYIDSKKEEHSVVFMGKSTEGKYILHFGNQSYANDLCLMESQMLKKCKLACQLQQVQPQKRVQSGLIGLPSGPNLGFINTIFMQLFNHKDTKKILKLVDEKRDDKLFYCLSKISNLLSKQCKVESCDIKLIVQLFFSQYTDFEVSMCFNALKDILNLLSEEFGEEKMQNSVEQFEMEVNKKVKCNHCHQVSEHKDKTLVWHVFLPEEEFIYVSITWVPVYSYSTQILKYVVKIKKTSTLTDLMNSFEQILGFSNRPYVLTEVHGNDIVKNFNFAHKSTTLEELKIRQTDKLFAFELINNFNNFVSTHFSSNELLDEDQIKKDMIIDCNHEDKGWIYGKVIDIDYLPYTQTSFVRVTHKFNKNQSWEITYNCFEDSIARFPLKSHKNCEMYHLRVQQRCFNEAANSMQLVGIPLVVALPAWMRWKEFFFLMYLQAGRFISQKYAFNPDEKTGLKSSKHIKNSSSVDKFKQFRNSSRFPYSLHLVDYEGRCVVCLKFLKTTVFKGQNQNYCEGCDLSNTEPISWQVKQADLMVCIDWRGSDRYQKDLVSNTKSSTVGLSELQKQEECSLEGCLNKMSSQYVEKYQYLCCNTMAEKATSQKMIKSSNSLIIFVERIHEQVDGFKRVIRRGLKLVHEGLLVAGSKYDLVGLTSIEGEHFNIRYKTYTRKDRKDWYEYDGQLVRIVDTKHLDRQCALVLYYQKAQK